MRFTKLLIFAFVTGLLFSSSATLQAQEQKPAVENIDPDYISISNGLASPNVNNVIQDSFGLIWIATINGLQRYDGYRFETFKNIPGKATSIQNNTVYGLLEDDAHNIWIGNELGVSRYDRRKNEFKNYLFPGYFNTPTGVPYGRVFRFIQDSQKNIYAVTRYLGVIRYNPKIDNWEQVPYKIQGIDVPDHYDPCIALTEDQRGGIWYGSMAHGLMYKAKTDSAFTPVADKQLARFTGGASELITAIFSDSTHTLWFTSRNGIYKYNPETNVLRTIKTYEVTGVDQTFFNAIVQDKHGNVWISNNMRGILRFEGITDRYTEMHISGKVIMRDFGWNITLSNFMIDQSGIFWFCSQEFGLMKYNPVNKPFKHLAHDANNPNSMSAGATFGILASKANPGIVYVGKRGTGIDIYDPKKQTFRNIRFEAQDDMFNGAVRAIAEKTDGSLWLGTWGDGIVELDKNYKEIRRFKYDSTNKKSLAHNQVRVLKPDGQGRLWIGTNNGLNYLTINTGAIQRISSKQGKQYPDKLVKELERLILTDQKIGLIDKVTDDQDISVPITIKTAGTYWIMSVAEMDIVSPADYGWIENSTKDTVWKMSPYEKTLYAGGGYKNRIEIGSVELQPGNYTLRYKTDDSHSYGNWNEQAPDQTSLYGIALIQPKADDQLKTTQTDIVPEREEMLTTGSNIQDFEITDRYIWLAAEGSGLDRIDRSTNQVKNYVFNPEDENSLSNNNIRDLHVDSHGMLWIATNEGINKFDPNTETFTRYTESDGLPTNLTEGIIEGDAGEMWIATQNGLAQMITNEALNKVTFINYNSTDGLGTDVYVSLTNTRASDGKFYFGGDHGLTTFSEISSNKTPPSIIISNLFISNKSVMDMKDESPLTESLLETKTLTLPYDQNSLSFEFAALHYANPQKNQYAHMLKGYDQDWIYDNRNYAAYTNLEPGKYEFLIRASNAYGVWNEKGLVLEIIILPPWWRTWWAYALYVIAFFILIYVTYFAMRAGIKIRERERSRQKELQHAKAIEKAYTELKTTQAQLIQSEKMASLGELTAGIAHEIQNPLNFVNNFSEVSNELIDEMKSELASNNIQNANEIANNIKQNLDKIAHHGKRADAIVKGMLQHSQSSNGVKTPTDINALADEYLRLSYHGLRAKDKSFQATMKTDFDSSIRKIDIVSQDIGRVILNLLTNAFYAVNEKLHQLDKISGKPDGSYVPTVTIQTKKQGNHVEINITDNGNGVPQHIIDKIFQPFFTTKPTGQGTGLGLSLSYDIVTNGHGGELKVATSSTGSTFTILLPV